MRETITIKSKYSGFPLTGYTAYLYAYTTATPYYSTSSTALYTFTDNSDGTYYIDCTTTIKGTVVIVSPGGTTTVPANYIGHLFEGDNQPTIAPEGST
jgi:hypothetical protein